MIILASGSPRRKELLSQMGFEFEIITSDADETPIDSTPDKIVENLSLRKAEEVYAKIHEDDFFTQRNLLIIAADTLVFHKDGKLGKPKDRDDAVAMLRRLSGDIHQVYTGVSMIYVNQNEKKKVSFSEKTDVSVAKMTDYEIGSYVDTKEPMDKAGAYAIQGFFAKYITSISGEYSNVVGLPVARLYSEMKKIGFINA